MAQLVEFFGNHVGLFVALGVVGLLLIGNEVHGALTGGKRLSVPEAVRLINDRDPIILDVRTPADFKKGHLLNAQNAPLTKLDESLGAAGKDKSKPVLVYCALGLTVADVTHSHVQTLAGAGEVTDASVARELIDSGGLGSEVNLLLRAAKVPTAVAFAGGFITVAATRLAAIAFELRLPTFVLPG